MDRQIGGLIDGWTDRWEDVPTVSPSILQDITPFGTASQKEEKRKKKSREQSTSRLILTSGDYGNGAQWVKTVEGDELHS